MSDALTDLARDERRTKLYNEYLESLRLFLQNPTIENKTLVIQSASFTDNVLRGFSGSRTNLADDVDNKIELLRRGNKATWAKFLFNLKNDRAFKIFKALSPFAGKLLIAVDYGCGFVNFYGDIEDLASRLIGDNNGLKTYDADDYLIVLDEPNLADAEVHWVRCGILGIKEPRKKNPEKTS